uniref:ATPase family associated with various cellular activities (AAA) n=1 Tax=Candidatus Kentrum sp. TUN TaxID=2126343 RepID=A0A451AGU6_9GAMM|nr:MAG: ATPase family associated with various cellular activities (AAA) [Candidatus Kentron sp. TUN]VFK65255.1 MAG: ATPase family associated with various cellular activities (AAA) [Candidatus Kentron sp. TUN]
MTAEVLASELGLPLAVVRIDNVVSSYLGETASNLRQVFDFIASIPMVALFDEFDALAKERADSADHGELKRVVNAFLQLLDIYHGKSLLIATTNHEGILDAAVWRRFDEVLVSEPPAYSDAS